VGALLFERDRVEQVTDWASRLDDLGRSSILWIDVDEHDEHRLRETAAALGLARQSLQRLLSDDTQPFFADFEDYLHVTVYVPVVRGEETELADVECLVAEHWVLTVHKGPVPVFEQFSERVDGSGEVGRLDGPEFLADLLEWVLDAYLCAFEAVELDLEDFDTRVMGGSFEHPEDELRRLVEARQEVGRLRRALVSHRQMFLALTHPELDAITSSKHSDRFQELRRQLEHVVQAARDSRDSVVGSFDVLIARNDQRTSEIVKVLTLGSMLLLPGALIAGVLGMNFKVGFFDHAELFWVVVAAIVALAVATLAAARARRWI
jgi:magnesium transporter